ncbi:MAG: siderophore-interacting protein [Thermomicrobiales bacterium]
MIHTRYVQASGAFVFRPVEVVRSERVTPQMMRVTFGGESVSEIQSLAADDDVRIQFPERFDETPLPPVVEFQPFRLVYPANAPPSVIRALTIRALRPDQREIDIDIALHGVGILTKWAEQAAPGQRATIGGPRGSTVWEGEPDVFYLIGDPTALPAIGRFVESLPSGAAATVVAEVEDAAEEQQWTVPAGATLTTIWLHRRGQAPGRTTLLDTAIATLPAPTASTAIFAAGESSTMHRLRRWIRTQWPEIGKDQLNIAGYWRREDDEQGYFHEGEEETPSDS